MMFVEHFKLALSSIRGAKTRSALTMFGIVVGIASVVTIVSLGEGVKQQVSKQIDKLGNDLLVVQPGSRKSSAALGLGILNPTPSAGGSLSDEDIKAAGSAKGISHVAPIAAVSGIPAFEDRTYDSGVVLASNEQLLDLLKQKIEFGGYFDAKDLNKNFAVIGRSVAYGLFEENVPIGKTLHIRGQDFLVIGIFEQASENSLSYSIDFDNSIIIPFEAAKLLGSTQTFQLLAKINEDTKTDDAVTNLSNALRASRGGQDFSVLRQEDTAAATEDIFYQVTLFVGGVALISLVVGGIGIMNIMFATVSERTKEIGIRKAIGATNRQILDQFLMEAIVISAVGCFFGVIISLLINAVLRVTTNLQPAITIPVLAVAVAAAAFIGILSGILPAAKAAKKDPIDALRYDQ